MQTKGTIKIVGLSTYSATVEQEKRFKMNMSDVRNALVNKNIKIYDAVKIEQVWFGKSSQYTARIRKTENIFKSPQDPEYLTYEHTVKHHIGARSDYEVTTDLTGQDYDLLKKLYKSKPVQNKIRLYVNDIDGVSEDYIITLDMVDGEEGLCYVEFELKENKVGVITQFKKPDWVIVAA